MPEVSECGTLQPRSPEFLILVWFCFFPPTHGRRGNLSSSSKGLAVFHLLPGGQQEGEFIVTSCQKPKLSVASRADIVGYTIKQIKSF